ncbi:hypothetical protein OCHUTO_0698 [Orientia chuto str. Dubai]|uniref:Uncharacterized protein n=1 Tax=Orientia chuto str. Dubai TaxID=1359168 RepID=A0A0F3MJ32_9RICK|nr:hypothetical protein [Candidatus Orientia mediorientalis]KJV55778.1 hypothetical protein OCHUTO_0698 [Orientia chuto str. Dubai]
MKFIYQLVYYLIISNIDIASEQNNQLIQQNLIQNILAEEYFKLRKSQETIKNYDTAIEYNLSNAELIGSKELFYVH